MITGLEDVRDKKRLDARSLASFPYFVRKSLSHHRHLTTRPHLPTSVHLYLIMPSSRSVLATSLALTALLSSSSSTTVQAVSAKKGIAWPWFESTPAEVFGCGASWIYNWERYAPTGGSYGDMEFVPMIRTAAEASDAAAYSTVQDAEWVLGFNEPDQTYDVGGSSMNATYAASLWKQYIHPLRTSTRKLVAPAMSSAGADWLAEFITACTGCVFDAYAYHPYASNRWGISALTDNFIAKGYYPLWVTEFNVFDASDGGTDMIDYLIDYFENNDKVARYSMIARLNQNTAETGLDLQNTDGSLTDIGTEYITYE